MSVTTAVEPGLVIPFKKCGCGRVYTLQLFFDLPTPPGGGQMVVPEGDKVFVYFLRNCVCRSTIAIETRVTEPVRADVRTEEAPSC